MVAPDEQLAAVGIADPHTFRYDYNNTIMGVVNDSESPLELAMDWFSTDSDRVKAMSIQDQARYHKASFPLYSFAASTRLGYLKLNLVCEQWAQLTGFSFEGEGREPSIPAGPEHNLVTANDQGTKTMIRSYSEAIKRYDDLLGQLSDARFTEFTEQVSKRPPQKAYTWLTQESDMAPWIFEDPVRDSWQSSLDAFQALVDQAGKT